MQVFKIMNMVNVGFHTGNKRKLIIDATNSSVAFNSDDQSLFSLLASKHSY